MAGESDDVSASPAGVESLLQQVGLLWKKYEALAAANGENFNVFELLRMETDEVRTHSAMLADLLDPRGSHGQGTAFARLFRPLSRLSDDELKSARVGTEVAVVGGRLDILIETNHSCIVIENKVYAADQEQQLERYHDFASSRGKVDVEVYYLTLAGDAPGKSSLGDLAEGEVKRISYQTHVLGWLDLCIERVARIPRIREVLNQYRAVVRTLTGVGQENLTMKLKELLERKQGDAYNFELAPDIAKALTEVSIQAEWKFWKALRDELVQSEPGNLLEDEGVLKRVTPRVLRTAHSEAQGKWNYGWTFRLVTELPHVASRGEEIRLRVSCGPQGLAYFGLIGVEREGDAWIQLLRSDARELFDWWSPKLSTFGGTWRPADEHHLGWCYPKRKVDLRKTPALAPDVIRTFLEEDALWRDVVDPLVAEIRDTIHRLVGISASGGS